MKKVILAVLVVGLIVCLAAVALREKKKAEITDFSWSVVGKTAPYTFRIANQTNEPLTVVVFVEAQNTRESRGGTVLSSLGSATVEVVLASQEEKKIAGVIDLISFGSSNTVVSFSAAIKPPNQALQHNDHVRHGSCLRTLRASHDRG